jgi:hypothetical protein
MGFSSARNYLQHVVAVRHVYLLISRSPKFAVRKSVATQEESSANRMQGMQNFGDSGGSCCVHLKTSSTVDTVLLGYGAESMGIRIPTFPGNGIRLPADAMSYCRSAKSMARKASKFARLN